jgi:hypothetical protein
MDTAATPFRGDWVRSQAASLLPPLNGATSSSSKTHLGNAVPKVRVQDWFGFADCDPNDAEEVCAPDATPKFNAQYRETLPNGKSYLVLDSRLDFPARNTETFVVPAGHYFMMGDNRDNSNDSRLEVGYVPAENLVGKAIFRFFSTDGSILEVWNWRFDRMFTGID